MGSKRACEKGSGQGGREYRRGGGAGGDDGQALKTGGIRHLI